MNEPPAEFPGPDAQTRAVALAGWLAEHGVREVTIESGSDREDLHARATDLPGHLLRLTPCVLLAGGLRFRIEPGSIRRE